MREREFWRTEIARLAGQQGERDPEKYVAWRRTARPENLRAIDFYGRYLVGQYAGMGTALSLDAVRAALDIDGIDRQEWPEMTSRLITFHGLFCEATKAGS